MDRGTEAYLGEDLVRIHAKYCVTHNRRSRRILVACFGALMLRTVGSWEAYIWGASTEHNS